MQHILDEADEWRTAEQWQEEVRAKIDGTVRLHLIADVPVGAFLSGGVRFSPDLRVMQVRFQIFLKDGNVATADEPFFVTCDPGLLIDVGEAILHHERDLGAVEADAGCPGLIEMRQVDEQPGIEIQRHRDAI